MEIVTHITQMIEKGTISAYVALGIVGVVGVLVLFGALKGLSRGITRQTVRLVTVLISAVAAYFTATMVTGNIIGVLEGKTLEEFAIEFGLTEYIEQMGEGAAAVIYGLSAETVQYLLALPLAIIISPFVFLLMFELISSIMLIVHAVISGACGFSHKKNNAITRITGMLMGAVQGVLVSAMVLLPVLSLTNLCADTVKSFEDGEPTVMLSDSAATPEQISELEASITDVYDEYLSDVVNSPILKILDTLGGNRINRGLATVKIGGVKQDMRKTIPVLIDMASDVMKLSELDVLNLSDADKTVIENLVAKVSNERFTALVISDVFKSVAIAVDAGLVDMNDVPSEYHTMIYSAVEVFAGTTPEDVGSDLGTLCNIFFIVSDSGLMSGEEIDVLELIGTTGDANIILQIFNELSGNDRYDRLLMIVINGFADGVLSGEIDLGDEINAYRYIIDPVLEHFADMADLSNLTADFETITAIVAELNAFNDKIETGEIDSENMEQMLTAILGESSLLDSILSIVSDNEALSELIVSAVGGAAGAIIDGELDIGSEVGEYLFMIEPVFLHFCEMSDFDILVEDIDLVSDIVMELVEAGVLGEEEIDDPLEMFLLGEEALIDTILNKVSENEAFSEVILEVVVGAATAIKNDEFDAIELNRLNFEERTVIIELLEVFEDTESFAVLQDDVADIKKIIEHLTVLEDADETAILDLLFSKEEDEESLIVQILNDVDLTRFDGVILTAVKLYCSEIPTPDDEMIAELFGALIGVVEELESFTELKDSVIVIEDIITYIGIDAISGEDVDYFQLMFKVEAGETDSVIRKILNRINGSVFEAPIVRAIQTLATPDSDGKYAILESLSEPLPTIIGPLLEVLAATDDISVISDDFVYIEDLVSLLDENGLLEEDSEIDYISLMFKSEGFKEDGVTAEDTLLVKIINVIEPSRYNAALLEAIQGAADEMLDMEDMDASLRVVVDSLLTLLNDAETLTDIKNDVNAISRVIEVLETDGVLSDGGTDAFALLTKNEIDGKTTVHRVLDIFDDGSDLERFALNVITGLAGGVAAGEIDLGTLQSPASEFVMATMNVLKDTSDVATIRNDVTTISNIIDILDKNNFISDDEENPITIDVIELFTQPGVGSTEHTVIDLVLAEFEDNSHLNPVLLALVQSLATQVRTISVAEPFDMLVGSVADVFTLRSTEDTVVGDVATVAEVFEILASSGVFAPECDATNLLTVKDIEGRTVVDRVVTVLNDNERTQPIVTDFTKLSLSLIMNNNVAGTLGDASGSTADVDRVYEDVKTGLDSIISETVNGEHETEEEKKEAVTEAITDIITNVILGGGDSGDGATGGEGEETLAPEMVDIMADIMADHVIENFGGVTAEDLVSSGLYEELEVEVPVVDEDGNPVLDADGNEVTETVTQTQISDSGITDVILNYYDAYLQWLASQSGGSGT